MRTLRPIFITYFLNSRGYKNVRRPKPTLGASPTIRPQRREHVHQEKNNMTKNAWQLKRLCISCEDQNNINRCRHDIYIARPIQMDLLHFVDDMGDGLRPSFLPSRRLGL